MKKICVVEDFYANVLKMRYTVSKLRPPWLMVLVGEGWAFVLPARRQVIAA